MTALNNSLKNVSKDMNPRVFLRNLTETCPGVVSIILSKMSLRIPLGTSLSEFSGAAQMISLEIDSCIHSEIPPKITLNIFAVVASANYPNLVSGTPSRIFQQ